MKLYLSIDMDNDAFYGENANPEAARILRNAAERIENGSNSFSLFDVNGNKVGDVDITEIVEAEDAK